jgi:UPF0176 protein
MHQSSSPPDSAVRVVALYKFTPVGDPSALREAIEMRCRDGGIRGTMLVAGEGVNGTLAGPRAAIDGLVGFLAQAIGRDRMEVKFADAQAMPFHRLKVKVKPEIVTLRVGGLDFEKGVGAYVEPTDWNALIADPDTVVIDTRNEYEVSIGSFERAEDPKTTSFTEFPGWVEENRERLEGKRIAMFCTGGIRCEKASAFMKSAGFPDVYHLKGGILRYLEEVPATESLWQGECFVFDERVSVGHGLQQGAARICRVCQTPLDAEALASPLYEEWVSCPACHGERTEEDRERYRERQKQVLLAARSGHTHIGSS